MILLTAHLILPKICIEFYHWPSFFLVHFVGQTLGVDKFCSEMNSWPIPGLTMGIYEQGRDNSMCKTLLLLLLLSLLFELADVAPDGISSCLPLLKSVSQRATTSNCQYTVKKKQFSGSFWKKLDFSLLSDYFQLLEF